MTQIESSGEKRKLLVGFDAKRGEGKERPRLILGRQMKFALLYMAAVDDMTSRFAVLPLSNEQR